MHWLRFKGTRFPIRREETLIGRSAYCTIVLSNELASRKHCTLRNTPEGLVLTDLGSTHGTFVNDHRLLGPQLLAPGDRIRVGADVLELQVGETPVRSQCETGGRGSFAELSEETTRTRLDLLELLEMMLERSDALSAEAAALAVVSLLDSLMRQCERTGPLSEAQRTRVLAALERVEGWSPAHARAGWAENVRRALALPGVT